MNDIGVVIINMISERGEDKSVCPSEIARRIWPEEWRSRMDEIRREAYRLARMERISITQGGKVVDPSTVKGPIRLTLNRLQ